MTALFFRRVRDRIMKNNRKRAIAEKAGEADA